MKDNKVVTVQTAAALSHSDHALACFEQALARGRPTEGVLRRQLECPRER